MSSIFEIQAESRTDKGKAAARRMRRLQDTIPAVVYGAGKDSQAITLSHNEIRHTLDHEAVFSHILTLKVDGKDESVVLKDVQRHAYKPKILHVDFLRIKAKEKLNMNVPLHFMGEADAPGVKAGGVVSKMMTEIEISCLPANLPQFIEVDMSALEMEHSVHLAEVKLPKGVELATELSEDHNPGVVSIHKPKVEKELTAEELAAESAAADAAADGEKSDDAAASGDKSA